MNTSYTLDEYCIFCNERHCIEELTLRPLLLELNAFSPFAEMEQSFLLENSQIIINYPEKAASYILHSDILLSEFKFTGDVNFYFSMPTEISWIAQHYYNRPELMKLINTIESGWPSDNLERHGIEVIR